MNPLITHQKQLTKAFEQLREEPDCFKAIQSALTAIESIHLAEKCPMKDRRDLRSILSPSPSDKYYTASALCSAFLGIETRYFRIYNQMHYQTEELTNLSAEIKKLFYKYRNPQDLKLEDYSLFERTWDRYEHLLTLEVQASVDKARHVLREVGQQKTPLLFIAKMNELSIHSKLSKKIYKCLQDLPEDSVLRPFFCLMKEKLKELRNAFQNDPATITKDLPTNISEKLLEIDELLTIFEKVENDMPTQLFLKRLTQVVKEHPEMDVCEPSSSFEIPCLALYAYWNASDEKARRDFFGTTEVDEENTLQLGQRAIPRFFHQKAWQMHTDFAKPLTLYLGMAARTKLSS